jgi:SAM-dependent methyltransferase
MKEGQVCPLCRGSLGPAFLLSRGPVVECAGCGVFIAREESVSPEQDRQFHQAVDERRYVGYFEPFRKDQYRQVLGRLDLATGQRLLDVGASYGWMVDVALELGLDGHGIEPSPMTYEPRLHGRIARRTLEEHAAQAAERYDVITIWHVLEHLRDPTEAARQLRDLLQDGGTVVIAVPNARGRMHKLGVALAKFGSRRLVEELWYTHNPNMHRYYPTRDALGFILGAADLQIVESYTLDAFDWRRLWTRSTNRPGRMLLRTLGPVLHYSRLTATENLIAFAK